MILKAQDGANRELHLARVAVKHISTRSPIRFMSILTIANIKTRQHQTSATISLTRMSEIRRLGTRSIKYQPVGSKFTMTQYLVLQDRRRLSLRPSVVAGFVVGTSSCPSNSPGWLGCPSSRNSWIKSRSMSFILFRNSKAAGKSSRVGSSFLEISESHVQSRTPHYAPEMQLCGNGLVEGLKQIRKLARVSQ